MQTKRPNIKSNAPKKAKVSKDSYGYSWLHQHSHTISRAEINKFLGLLPRKTRRVLKAQLKKERRQIRLKKSEATPTVALIKSLKLIAEAERNNDKARQKAQQQEIEND